MDQPSFANVRKFGSDIYSVSSQPHLNPPCEAHVREIGSSLIKDTDYRDISCFQPQLNPLLSRGAMNPHLNTSDVQSGQSEEELAMADVVAASPVFEKFKIEVERLKVMKRQVQEQIGIAKDKGDKILSGVEEWLNKAGDDLSKAEVLLEQEATAKKRCFEEFDHYGKMATNMTPSLLEHQVHGKDFVTSVSDDTSAPEFPNVYENKDLDDIVIQNSALNNIIKSLEDESKQIIGIYGLGGVGKTTLAMKAVARVKHLFVHVAFSTVSQTVNAKMIQKDLEKATERIVKGEKVLIILDDVWEKLDLEKLCIPINNTNCKVLLTSRSEEVCQKMNAESKIYVDSLPAKEAWILFKHVVGERLETDSNLKLVALKIVKECVGLPLFIQVVGNALKNEAIISWESALIGLQKDKPSKIDPDTWKAFSCLKLSYDYLKSEEAKSCFLLCSLFHEAEDIELEDLVRYVVGLELFDKLNSIEDARGRVQNAVNILISFGLLLYVEYDKRCTKMRNIVRDVALLIAYEGKDKCKFMLKAGKDLIECLPRNNNVKDLTEYKQTNFDDFHGSFDSMIRMLDKKAPLRAVSKATNHYHDQNIIKDRGSGKVYKGKLKWNGRLMDVAVWRLDRQYRESYVAFRRELEILSELNHDNISSIVKYFDQDEDGKNIIIYENAFHGNLLGHLRNPDPEFTWSRRLQICLGVARALNYIHNQARVHCDINSSKILLDKDWEPKIFGFELCTDYPQSWMHRLHFSHSLGNTSVMTPKYDVYLFGVLLFEVLCGNKPMFGEDGLYKRLDNIIESSLRKYRESRSMKSFIKIAYSCLDKELEERPSMNKIVKVLEEALELQRKEENLERSTNRDEGASQNRFLMQYLEIPLQKIYDATDNFKKGRIGHGAFGTVYEARLDVLDIESVSTIEGKSKDELPRKISKTVAIKRLPKNGDEQAETSFLTEIGSLTSCIHPNVVPFLGYCREANEMILVFEHASNGDLGEYLGSKRSLTWSQRIHICLDVAHGINCLHANNIIHRDIKSKNILLDENLNAKVADFGLSTLIPTVGSESRTILTNKVAGTWVYIDPEYRTTGGYKKESDIYALGVVLFELLSGKMAYDPTYTREYDDGLAPIVRRRFEEGTLTELIDSKMFEEDDAQHTFTLNRGPTQNSYNLFSKIGYECLAKTRAERPKMEVVIKALQDALEAQGETMVLSRFRLSSIEDATQNFAKTYYVGLDTSGNKVYEARIDHFKSNSSSSLATTQAKRRISIVIKRVSAGRVGEHGEEGFFSEIEMHTRNKHPNIVPLLGICYERDNMLLVYEHAAASDDETLDDYLSDTDDMSGKHTWIQRLHQCLGIARGLNHLHALMDQQAGKQEMIHVDIRSANILLGKSADEEAKIAYFGFSKLLPPNQEASTDTTIRTKVYRCPADYQETGELKKQSDIYSFGVVLFEIFCGRVAYDPDYTAKNDNGLAPIARQCFSDGTIMEMIDPALKEESTTVEDKLTSNTREPILDSLGTYLRIANQCLADNQAERPTMQIVIEQLEKALSIHNPGDLVEKASQNMNVQSEIYNDSLPVEEAWILFKSVVGERVETDADIKRVAKKVAKECGGLPLLIEAVGNALKEENMDSWKAALSRLRKPAPSDMDPDIKKAFTCLQLCYDYLQSEEAKTCFLLCSMYPNNCKIWLNDLEHYMVGLEKFDDLESMKDAAGRVQDAVDTLTSSGLLLDVGPDVSYTLIHHVVRDVGLLIASINGNEFLMQTGEGLKDQWPPKDTSLENYKGISIIESDIIKLPDYKVNVPNIEIFLCFYNWELSIIPDEFMGCINNVKVIDMSNNKISSLPQSFGQLTKLRSLDIRKNRSLQDISILGGLRDLEILIANETAITEIPKEFGQLVNLRVLGVEGCAYLSYIPQGVMSALIRLEELSIDLRGMAAEIIMEVKKLPKLKNWGLQ